MSLRQFIACVDGWNRAHGAEEKPDFPTEERFEEMKALHGDA